MDDLLSGYYSRRKDAPERSAECLSVDELERYVSGLLDPEALYRVGGHVKNCAFCSELIEGALLYSAHEKHIALDKVPDKIRTRAKSLNPSYRSKEHKTMNFLKGNIWLMLSMSSIAASFFMPQYFFQFLILAVIFGLKWVFNRESTRALIMVYNAWKKHDQDSDKELDRIFKSRF
ncbi:MAG: hypothetical protein ISS26_06475 [Candidatus Omnitrophica bacterium]|nr:hypothetical protein [Candidatus Omnitrophota bacterium]